MGWLDDLQKKQEQEKRSQLKVRRARMPLVALLALEVTWAIHR